MNQKLVEPKTLPGFRDFLPADAKKRQWLREKLEKIFELWGYDPMETPTLEYLEMFSGQIGEDEKLFFKFTDQGGREVALRYDQTVPTTRAVVQYESQIVKPFKRYQIQPAFRSEKPQKGRYREFLQCDADTFGDASASADAEVICLSIDIYRQLGFKNARVIINDRKLMAGLPYEAVVAIDKLQKIGDDGVIADMVSKGIPNETAKDYLRSVKNLKPNETVETILAFLKSYGIPNDWYAFEPTLARSFSYSDGPIWEVIIPEYTSGSVLGGERYDQLFRNLFGKEVFGTGFALGFDRTLEAAAQAGLVPDEKTSSKVLVTVFSKDLTEKSLEILKTLRESGINSEMAKDDVKLEKQLRYANNKGIRFAVIIGPDEATKNLVTVKDLSTKSQKTIPEADLLNEIR